MSQINPNEQSNNSGSGGYHPAKRTSGHRGSQQQQASYNPYATGAPAGAFVTTDAYMNAYQQVYSPYYPQQQFFSPQGTYMNVAPAYSPRSDYNGAGQHKLNITTPNGDKVDLRSLNSTYTPKSSNASLNKSSSTTPKAPGATTAVNTNQRNPRKSAAKDPELEDLREQFRKQIQLRAQKAKEQKSSPAPASATLSKSDSKPIETSSPASSSATPPQAPVPAPAPKSVSPSPAPVAAKPSTPVPTQAPVASKPVTKDEKKVEDEAEETRRKFKELVAQKTKAQVEASASQTPEPTKEESTSAPTSSEIPATEEKEEESALEQAPLEKEEALVKSEDTKATTVEEPKPEEQSQSNTTSEATELKNITEETASEEKTEEATSSASESTFTISRFFEQIEKANIIENPFEFNYPEGKAVPDSKLKPTEAITKKFRYDPVFLLQFGEQCQFQLDDEFKERTKFIQISDKRNDRSMSKGGPGGQFRSGFGQGSIGGIQGSQFSKSGSSRKPMDFNSRSNSRQNSKRRGGSGRNERKSNRNRGDRDTDREPEVPAEPVKPLEKSATRWVPKSRAAKTAEVKYAPDGVTVILSAEDVSRKVKSLLNKLTLEYFEEISNEIINIANQSRWEENAETLKSVLELTFAKACDEPHWSSMYAQFCAKMCKDMSQEVSDKEVVNKNTNEPIVGGALVRRHLLTRCQIEYTKGWADKLPTNEDGSAIEPEMMSDEYYEAAKAKRRGLGLIRFIGHLYVLGLLSDAIILLCLNDQSKNIEDPSEDTVENLIQLIRTVGQKLDTHHNPQTKGRFDMIFPRIQQLSQNEKLSSRLQFKLLDVVDLRKKRWAGGEDDVGPKTISEIHEEAEKKQREDEKASKERRNQDRNDSRSNSSRSNWGGKVSSSDIKNVGVVRNSHSSSNLGPMNNFNRSKSLRSSGRQSSQNASPSESSNTTAPVPQSPSSGRQDSKKAEQPAGNRFALLNDEEQHNDHSDEEQQPEEEKAETESEAAAPAEETTSAEPEAEAEIKEEEKTE